MNPNEKKTEDEIATEIDRVFGNPTDAAIEAAMNADTIPDPINPPHAFDVSAWDGFAWGDDQ